MQLLSGFDCCGLADCGAQNETIGQGEHELVFTNEGNISVPITVRWTSWNGYIEMEQSTVHVAGRVALKSRTCRTKS